MKRFILCSLLMVLSFVYVSGQTVTLQITGTVTDANNGSPVANHPVLIMSDSMSGVFFYYNQVFTDAQGIYFDTVSIPANTQIVFYISTFDCNGNYMVQTAVPLNQVITANFSICTGGPSNCLANFMAIPDSSNPIGNLTYYFYDLSVGNPNSWYWDFGDGTSSTLQYPVHTYAQPGSYNVCLTIATATSCTSTFCSTITIYVQPSCYAFFTYSPDSTGYGFQFTDASIGNPTNWQWSFGDGTGSNLQNPAHMYNAPGNYYVCLTIWGNNCQSNYCEYVYVSGGQGCTAQFMAFPDSGNYYTWYFASFSIGNVVSWNWSFGDGSYSTQQYPVHTYTQTGTYTVCLTIFTSDSCTSTFCDSLLVGINPNPCTTYFTYTTTGLTVAFNGWTYNGTPPYTYLWDFGDGTTSNQQNPVHTYPAQGSYTVTLTGTDGAGCSSTYSSYVWVGNNNNGTIWGQVFAGGAVLDHGWVYLYMSGGPSNTWLPVDSTLVDSSGFYHFFMLNPLPGIYYVKAVPSANSVFYTNYLPTYYYNTAFWADANPINLIQPANPYNILLVSINAPLQGNGNINGQVSTGGKFNASILDAAEGVEVLLLDMSDTPLAIEYSDSQGHFSFNNLALGTYKIYAEVSGLPTDPAIVTLTGANPTVNDVAVIITPNGVITGIDEDPLAPLSVNSLYPNPATDIITLGISVTRAAETNIYLLNILGDRIISQSEKLSPGEHTLSLSLQEVPAGTYLLRVSTDEGTFVTHKLTLIR
jgi:PKD repeat protein